MTKLSPRRRIQERSYRALAYDFTVGVEPRELAEFIHHKLEPFSVPYSESTPRRYYLGHGVIPTATHTLTSDGSIVASSEDGPGMLIEWLVTDAAGHAVREATGHVAVHASVAAEGRDAVVMPGPPDSGKSTLVAGLVREGFSFLSDEVAPFRADGAVVPFPRPLLLDPGSVAVIEGLEADLPAEDARYRWQRYLVAPDELRPGCMGEPCRTAFVVAPRYVADQPTRLEPMSRSEALGLLVDQCFNLDLFRGAGVRLLAEVVSDAACYRLVIGDLPSAVAAVRRLFSERGSPGS